MIMTSSSNPADRHSQEIASGERFRFGENWARFLAVVNEDRILAAEQSLRDMLGVSTLAGRNFIDVGSGSGLFSLAARRLGARVFSFDYDPQSVECTQELRRRFFRDDSQWEVQRGSVLDPGYLGALGSFDVVYSWGVLHHTGDMYGACRNVVPLVAARGQLFIALYNDQGAVSRYWLAVKRVYNSGAAGRWLMSILHAPYLVGVRWLLRALTGRSKVERGMTLWRDMFDWLGGYPFEVSKPEEILRFYRERDFELENLRTCGGRMGCNEFVFRRKG
jgi:2-polyprenyl-6-hydroxyphenyl methylase/3-demethylubiquinone-9 3-methyltransferase